MLNWIVWNRTDYLHENDLELNYRQRLICHKKPTNQPTNIDKFTLLKPKVIQSFYIALSKAIFYKEHTNIKKNSLQ